MKPLLIVNPRAAGSRTGERWTSTARAVREAIGEFEAAFTEYQRHAEQLARLAVLNGRELVVAVGGDGTLSDVVNGVFHAAAEGDGVAGLAGPPREPVAAVGYIAQGTGGDFRRSLGHKDSLPEYLTRLGNGDERRLDVGLLEYADAGTPACRRYFLNIVSAGMGGLVDKYVTAAPRWVGGHLAYYGATLRALAAVPLARLLCRVTLDGVTSDREIDSRVVAVCNGAYFGSGMRMAPDAVLDDGRFEVVNIGTSTRFELLAKSPTVYRGTHYNIAAVQHFRCQRIEMRIADEAVSAERFPLDVDGDFCGHPPLTVEVLPAALRFRG